MEIKPNGGEPLEFEKKIVKKIRDLGVAREFKLMSLDMAMIDRIEQMAPEIQTGYVVPMIFGNFSNARVDFYAIEDFSYKERFSAIAHKSHREIYIWTLNTDSELSRYLNLPIDGIITDKLTELKNLELKARKNESLLESFWRIISLRI